MATLGVTFGIDRFAWVILEKGIPQQAYDGIYWRDINFRLMNSLEAVTLLNQYYPFQTISTLNEDMSGKNTVTWKVCCFSVVKVQSVLDMLGGKQFSTRLRSAVALAFLGERFHGSVRGWTNIDWTILEAVLK